MARSSSCRSYFWHLLKVRDEASSRKLRAISRDDCAALFQAAAEDRAREKARRTVRGKEAPEESADKPSAGRQEAVAHGPRAPGGRGRAPDRTGRARWRPRSTASGTRRAPTRPRKPASAAIVVNRKSDLAAAHWGLPSFHIYGTKESRPVTRNLHAAAEFLKGNSEAGDLPRTNYLWFSMLEKLPLRCWQTYWRALAAKLSQKDGGEVPWLEFLKLWHDLGIAELPGQFDIMEGHPEGAKKNELGRVRRGRQLAERHSPFKNGEDRFIVVANQSYHHDQLPYQFLRYSTAKTPGCSARLRRSRTFARSRRRMIQLEIAAFIAAAESCTRPPLPSRAGAGRSRREARVSPRRSA